ncbi:DUF3307 domain-containing protein [Sphingobacterium bovistauri]|uniref:DUF3307 domain-containing protein n=1 Tax=Sphingobacterium bovistauri TaxID=2781959 RepID=A0ABS7Z995_9SPHI|nr:DUF3307 domain-containing protein [Sphingobacterium bovistauri]MCA5006765.1 DUF3307 domain-containing protein [Sphingobacterium bovistauri]
MLILFLKILLAHILGDFVLQTKSMVEKRKENVAYLVLHVLIHTGLLVLFLYADLQAYWMLIAFIAFSHLAIDSLKIWFESKYPSKPLLYFCIDQLLHILILIATVCYTYGVYFFHYNKVFSPKTLLYAIAFLLITAVSPIFLRLFFSKWNREFEFQNKRKDSLMNAGLLIGIMERLLIVLFIQIHFLEGIGFLLAAKSIFRFGDLANAKDTKFTEYILLGTLASFVIAIAIGYALSLALKFT